MQVGRAHGDAVRAQRAPRPHSHAPAARVLVDDVERLRGGDAEAAPLADREMALPGVAADDAAAGIDDLPAAIGRDEVRRVAAQEALLAAGAGEEAQVLALGLLRHGQPGAAGELADFGLGQLAEREPDAREAVAASAASM